MRRNVLYYRPGLRLLSDAVYLEAGHLSDGLVLGASGGPAQQRLARKVPDIALCSHLAQITSIIRRTIGHKMPTESVQLGTGATLPQRPVDTANRYVDRLLSARKPDRRTWPRSAHRVSLASLTETYLCPRPENARILFHIFGRQESTEASQIRYEVTAKKGEHLSALTYPFVTENSNRVFSVG
jgi:hypothetical protein